MQDSTLTWANKEKITLQEINWHKSKWANQFTTPAHKTKHREASDIQTHFSTSFLPFSYLFTPEMHIFLIWPTVFISSSHQKLTQRETFYKDCIA